MLGLAFPVLRMKSLNCFLDFACLCRSLCCMIRGLVHHCLLWLYIDHNFSLWWCSQTENSNRLQHQFLLGWLSCCVTRCSVWQSSSCELLKYDMPQSLLLALVREVVDSLVLLPLSSVKVFVNTIILSFNMFSDKCLSKLLKPSTFHKIFMMFLFNGSESCELKHKMWNDLCNW